MLHPPSLAESTINDFVRDGAVVIRDALNSTDFETLTRGIENNLAQPGELAAVASASDDPGRFFEDFCNWQRIAGYEQILKQSALPGIAAKLMQSQTARIYHDHLPVKEAGTKQPTPWHQDQPYYNVGSKAGLSAFDHRIRTTLPVA